MPPIQRRDYPLLSACGLNCGLCPRFHTDGTSRCPGCGGEGFGDKRPPCSVVACCARHDVQFCFQCGEYPCKRLEGAELCDSFISHRNMRADFERAKRTGLDAYRAELNEKIGMLRVLLDMYNDGRRKSLYCTAVNLLALDDVRAVMARIAEEVPHDAPIKEKAAQAAALFQAMADARQIPLRLNTRRAKQPSR